MREIIQADCLEVMKGMGDNSVDLTITDPPYGIKSHKGTNGFGSAKNRRYQDDWDQKIPSKEIFDEILRVSKNVILFGGNYFAHLLPPSKCWLVWDKKGEIAFQNPFADCELLYTTFKKPVKKYTFRQQGFITDSKDKRYHPTQKPSELVERLIGDFSGDGEVIFDPYLGSGTTVIACERLGRGYIGVEIDQAYIDIANERLRELQTSSRPSAGLIDV